MRQIELSYHGVMRFSHFGYLVAAMVFAAGVYTNQDSDPLTAVVTQVQSGVDQVRDVACEDGYASTCIEVVREGGVPAATLKFAGGATCRVQISASLASSLQRGDRVTARPDTCEITR